MKPPTSDLSLWRWRVSHQTVRLCLLLLPVWLLGAGELARFGWNNTVQGDYERNGMVRGRDYVQFYVAGALARENDWHSLYHVESLERAVARIVPAAAGHVPAPLYGPQVALLFAPWSTLSYATARWGWLIASAAIYLLAASIVIGRAGALRRYRAIVWLTVVCNPALAMLLSTGQTGALAALAWALAAAAYLRGRLFLFGLCLGLLAYKPPLLIGAIPVLLILGRHSALGGVALSAIAQVVASTMVIGLEPWRNYLVNLRQLSDYYFLTDTLPHQKLSILGFFQLLVGPGPTAGILSAVLVAGVLMLWGPHRRQGLAVWLLPMLAATMFLLSPHLYVYDLVGMAPALLLTADALAGGDGSAQDRRVAWSGYALLYAPFAGAMAQDSRVQLATLALLIFFLALHLAWTTGRAEARHARVPSQS